MHIEQKKLSKNFSSRSLIVKYNMVIVRYNIVIVRYNIVIVKYNQILYNTINKSLQAKYLPANEGPVFKLAVFLLPGFLIIC